MGKTKKIRGLIVGMTLLALIVAGCGGGEKQPAAKTQEKYPTGPITVIVSFAPGGGTDLGARMLLPHAEKDLGVPMTVVNKSGGGGWVGWNDLLSAKTDGYTIAYINTPNLMTGYLNPSVKRNKSLNDFEVLANHVVDYGALAIRPNEKRFTNIKEMLEYAKTNEVTCTTTGPASDDHIALLKINKAFGTKLVAVHTKGAAEGKSSVMGGHIDVYAANVGEVTIPHKDKELKVIGILSPERTKFLPDVPTLDESGYKGIYSWSARGLAAKKGISSEQRDKLVAAFEKAMKNPEHIKKMEEMGLEVKFLKGQDYIKLLKADEDGVRSVFDLLGWDKK